MKKCPFCGAEIEDEAKFCLYCMTALEEKKTVAAQSGRNYKIWIIFGAVLLCLLVGGTALFLPKFSQKKDRPTGEVSSETGTAAGENSASPSAAENESTHPEKPADGTQQQIDPGNSSVGELSSAETSGQAFETDGKKISGTSGENVSGKMTSDKKTSSIIISNNRTSVIKGSGDGTTAKKTVSAKTTDEKTTTGKPSKSSAVSSGGASIRTGTATSSRSVSSVRSGNSSKSDSVSTVGSTSSKTDDPAESVTYLYRDATREDDYALNSTITENAVVITGVSAVSKTGEYIVPESIGGKKVVAIMNLAFCAENVRDTVKKVVLPASVKTIHEFAFYHCRNMTDLYLKGNAVGYMGPFLPDRSKQGDPVTIHCSAKCTDRDLRTYKTACEMYGLANFEEWNG